MRHLEFEMEVNVITNERTENRYFLILLQGVVCIVFSAIFTNIGVASSFLFSRKEKSTFPQHIMMSNNLNGMHTPLIHLIREWNYSILTSNRNTPGFQRKIHL